MEVRVRPVADRPVQVGRDGMRRRRAIARSDQDLGAHLVGRVGLDDPDRRQPPSIGGVGRVLSPAGGREDLARLRRLRVDVDRPDRRPRMKVGLRPSIGLEGDRPAVGAPRDMVDAPVSRRHPPWPCGPLHADDEQVRPAVEMAAAFESPVDPRDPARRRGVIHPRLGAWPPGDRRDVADEEARRIDLSRVRETPAVG